MLLKLVKEGITGKELEHRLDEVHITANKNTNDDYSRKSNNYKSFCPKICMVYEPLFLIILLLNH